MTRRWAHRMAAELGQPRTSAPPSCDRGPVHSEREVFKAVAEGYGLARRYLNASRRDPWAVVEREWSVIEFSDERMQEAMAAVPGVEWIPHDPLELAARLLAAFGDFLAWEERNGEGTLWRFHDHAAAIERVWDESLEDDDDD